MLKTNNAGHAMLIIPKRLSGPRISYEWLYLAIEGIPDMDAI